MISESIENINNKMLLHKIQESQETLTNLSCQLGAGRGLFDKLDFIHQKSLEDSDDNIQSMTSNTIKNIKSKLQKHQNNYENSDGNFFFRLIPNNFSHQKYGINNITMLNLFYNNKSGQQKNINFSRVQPSLSTNAASIPQEMNESNCSTNLLTSSMNYNTLKYKKLIDEQTAPQEIKKDDLNNIDKLIQYQENKDFDLFSFSPLKMRNLNVELKQKQQIDLLEDRAFLIKEQNLLMLNHVVEQAESIAIDLSDREEDFSHCLNGFKQQSRDFAMELPLILQPSYLIQNLNEDQKLQQSEGDLLHLTSNISNISQKSVEDIMTKCFSGNNISIEKKDVPSLKRQSSEPLSQSIYKDQQNSSISPKSQRLSSKKASQMCKIDKKLSKKQQNQVAHTSPLSHSQQNLQDSSSEQDNNDLLYRRIGKLFIRYLKTRKDSCLLKSDKEGANLCKQQIDLVKNKYMNFKQKNNFDELINQQLENEQIVQLQAILLEFLEQNIELEEKLEQENKQIPLVEFQKIRHVLKKSNVHKIQF